MRVYFEKPRSVVGWKGFVNDPRLDGSFEINEGLRRARKLLVDINRLGLAAGTEFLDSILGQFYADLVSWGVIGARTVESQVHRELASGLPMPVGFKNRTDGDFLVAVDAVRAARSAHRFPMLARDGTQTVKVSNGNNETHVVLRGRHQRAQLLVAGRARRRRNLRKHGLPPFLMVDCSHANSGKDPSRQPAVASAVAAQLRAGERAIAGVMLESNLVGGAQEPFEAAPLFTGRASRTDALPGRRRCRFSRGLHWRSGCEGSFGMRPCADLQAPIDRPAKVDAGMATHWPNRGRFGRRPPTVRGCACSWRTTSRWPSPACWRFCRRTSTSSASTAPGTEAMEAMRRDRPDVAFLDMQMPGCDGLQAVAGLSPPSARPSCS